MPSSIEQSFGAHDVSGDGIPPVNLSRGNISALNFGEHFSQLQGLFLSSTEFMSQTLAAYRG